MKVLKLFEQNRETINKLHDSVNQLPLSVRTQNCLEHAGIEYIWQLIQKTEAELLRSKSFNRKALHELKDVLFETDLTLNTQLTRELKLALEIPCSGDEPSEIKPARTALPRREEIIARRDRLNWLIDNYDQVEAGLKAFDDSTG